MIPILYEGTETSFTTNGIGRLSDAISCNVVEERNGLYELEMQYPVDGIFYDEITEGRIILALPFDGGTTQPFTVYQITRPLNQIVTIKAQHISYMLSGIVVMPFTASSCVQALSNIETYSSTTNPFTFTTDKVVSANYKLEVPSAARAILAGSSDSILATYGKGDYEFDRFDVKLHTNRGVDNHVTLRYGKNITDIKNVIDMTSTYTGIVPYWSDSEGNLVTLTEKVVLSTHAGDYPYKIIKPVDFSDRWEDPPTETQLRNEATAYVTNNEGWKLKNNITVSFVALWNTEEYKNIAALERVKMCDVVHIIFPSLGIDVESKVIKTDFDVLQERYNSITVGDSYNSFSSMFTELSEEVKTSEKSQKSFVQKAVDHATELITGGLGGHVVISRNADGEPEEILIMDTDDISTASSVWRWNVNGLGYSSTGYDGQYGTAITMDGKIVADYITAGTMQANRVRAGLLEDEYGSNYWNLSTGEFKLSPTAAKIGTSTIDSVLSGIQSQIDGKIETWYQSTDPATNWSTTIEKDKHLGDLWYNTANGVNTTSRYTYDGSTYKWEQQSVPKAVFDDIDGKAQIFITTPSGPYNIGDLWFNSDTSDIMTCISARSSGYAASDWQKRNKYTDDSAFDSFRNGTYATFVTNTNNALNTKITTYYQTSAPTTHVTGDLWIDTDDGNKLYRWNGSSWGSVQDSGIQSALTAASNAQTTADGKIVTFAQTSAPTATDVGDLWIDTDDNNKLYRWSGSAWVAYTDTSGIAAYDATLDQAEIFDRLTDNGAIQGIYMDNGQLYINAEYIATGILADPNDNTTWDLSTGELTSKDFNVNSDNLILENGLLKIGDYKVTEGTTNRIYRRLVLENGAIVAQSVSQPTSEPESTDMNDPTKTVTNIGSLNSVTSYPGSTGIQTGMGLISENNLVLESKTGSCYLKSDSGIIQIINDNGGITINRQYVGIGGGTNGYVLVSPRLRIDGALQVSNERTGVYHQWLNGLSQDISIDGHVASFKNGVLVSYS